MHRRILLSVANSARSIRAVYTSPKGRVKLVKSFGDRAQVALGANFGAKMHSRSTRGNVLEKEKERFQSMTIEEKRKLYKCGSNYVSLSDVKSWPEYFKELPEESKEKIENPKYEVNPKLNELVSVWRGDITKLEIDAIVNAANNRLLGGGGVDGAIHSAAGSSLTNECAKLDGCETGDAKITLGYKLPASRVIHTVGPIGENTAKLRSCYERCLHLVQGNELKSVAFPCISTGIYGYPNRNAAQVALESARKWLEKDDNADKVDRIIFCLFLEVDVDVYEELMQQYFPIASDGEEKSEESNEQQGDAEKATAEEKDSDEKDKKKEELKETEEEKEEPKKDGEEKKDVPQDAAEEAAEAIEKKVDADGDNAKTK